MARFFTRNKSRLWRRLRHHETAQRVAVCHHSAVPRLRHQEGLLQVVLALALAAGEATWEAGAEAARLLRSTHAVLGHQSLQLLQGERPQKALVLLWRPCATRPRCSEGPCSPTRREDTGGSTSTLSLKRWVSKSPGCENNKSTQQAPQALVESPPSPLLDVLDPMEERALGQQIKANNNYYQINAV